jgi:hypothetical protein
MRRQGTPTIAGHFRDGLKKLIIITMPLQIMTPQWLKDVALSKLKLEHGRNAKDAA